VLRGFVILVKLQVADSMPLMLMLLMPTLMQIRAWGCALM